jgi:ABC-type transport system involved in multi-copper enzyme maturation permease subunit
LQVRRLYGLVAYVALLCGVALAAWPVEAGTGAMFLPYGYGCLVLGLLFLMPFAKNETDPTWNRAARFTLLGGGAALALAGLVGGTVNTWFLLHYGLPVAVLGLGFLWAFVALTGITDDLGYRVGVAAGVFGFAAFVVALVRSTFIPWMYQWGWLSGRVEGTYLQTAGVLVMAVGLLYMALGLGLTSDNRFVVLTRRELAAFFFSPMAYLVLFCFSVMAAVQYAMFVSDLLGGPRGRPMFEPIIQHYIFAWLPVLMPILVVPLLTMRLMSEEDRTGTLEVLMTAPVQEVPVVLSKFFAVLTIYLLVWLPYGLFLVALRVGGGEAFDYRPLISFTLALICSGAGFLSIGLFVSSLTRSQVVAGVFTAVVMIFMFVLYLIQFFAEGSAWGKVASYASYIELWNTSLQGKLGLKDVMFPLSAALFFLFLTTKVLESRKWR